MGLPKSEVKRAEPKWVRFEEATVKFGRKTKTWNVLTKDGEHVLGSILWFGRWRGYAFAPRNATIYEQRCLRDIAAFVEEQTAAHRAQLKQQKSPG